ncbi:ATP-dependent 6-phosphofructokinase [bacterium]|nr:ATP-dependent 6-phosphofructokinase [bacterium]
MNKKIGILTGGGDCPGLNGVIRGAVYSGIRNHDMEFVGLKFGWKGLLEKITQPLSIKDVSNILPIGGTILRTSRTNPASNEAEARMAIDNFHKLGLDAIIAIGGEDTLGAAYSLWKLDNSFNVVGVPKTIDNDLTGTDVTFGFDTALNIATEAIDRLHTTAQSHNRVIVVEIMGRHAGWITMESGLAGSADIILVPEIPFDLDKDLFEPLKKMREDGKEYAIIAVSEGAKLEIENDVDGSLFIGDAERDEFGHIHLGGIGKILADEIEDKIDWESRHVVLGHLQRGGNPSAFDRVLSTRFGVAATNAIAENKSGVMVALRGTDIVTIKMTDEIKKIKKVFNSLLDIKDLFRE